MLLYLTSFSGILLVREATSLALELLLGLAHLEECFWDGRLPTFLQPPLHVFLLRPKQREGTRAQVM